MFYEAKQSTLLEYEWVVEAINRSGDGEIYAANFSGPYAKERAEEYARLKNNGVGRNWKPVEVIVP